MRRRAVLAACGVVAMGVAACGLEPKGGARPARSTSHSRVAVGMFDPAAVIVHPLTRLFVDSETGTRIDAHVEFRDAAGDVVKGAGRLVLELYRESGPVPGVGAREQILRWEADLSDPAGNSRAFDRVTRTYRFELSGLPERAERDGLALRAVFTAAGRNPMSGEAPVGR